MPPTSENKDSRSDKEQGESGKTKQSPEEKKARQPQVQKTPEEVANYIYILNQQDPEYVKRYLQAAGFDQKFEREVWESYARLFSQKQAQEKGPVLAQSSRENRDEKASQNAEAVIRSSLEKAKSLEDKRAILEDAKRILGHYPSAREFIEKEIKRLENSQNEESIPDAQESNPAKKQGSLRNMEQISEVEDEREERTLGKIERDLLNTIRHLSEFDQVSAKERNSEHGRKYLEGLQNELEKLLEEKRNRAFTIESFRKEVLTADKKLASKSSEERAEFNKLLRDFRTPQDERHKEEEGESNKRDIPELQGRLNELVRQDGDISVLNVKKELRESEIRQILLEMNYIDIRDENRLKEIDERRSDAARLNELNERRRVLIAENERITESIKRIKAVKYQIAKLKIFGGKITKSGGGTIEIKPEDRFKDYADYAEKEEKYRKLLTEKVGDEKRDKEGIDFTSKKSFTQALEQYNFQNGVDNFESEENKEIIESYLQEANRRGYFTEILKELNSVLDDVRRNNRHPEVTTWSIPDSHYEQIMHIINKYLNDEGYLKRYLLNEVKAGRRSSDLEIEGDSYSAMDLDLDKFDGLIKFWLGRIKKSVDEVKEGKIPQKEFSNEFNLLGHEGKYWRINYAGYYDIFALTKDQFEEVATDFGEYLVSGAIERDPNKLISEFEKFSSALTSKAETQRLGGTTRSLKIQLRARVGLYAADLFAALANTENYKQIMGYFFKDLEGMEVIPESQKAIGGLVGLATRLIDRDRRFNSLFRYHGENGRFALEENKSGDYEYAVRERTEELLAEELMIYEISDKAPNVTTGTAQTAEEIKQNNFDGIVLYQTTEDFKSRFQENTEVKKIRDKVRNKEKLNPQERFIYESRIKKAREAVKFARNLHSALGERTLRAAPSYIVEHYKTTASGWYLDKEGNEVTRYGHLIYNGDEITIKAFMKDIEEKTRKRQQIHPNFLNVYHRIKSDREFVKLLEEKLRKKESISLQESEKYKKIVELLGNDNYVQGEELIKEKVDYVSKDLAIKFMQFADNVARIIAANENEKRKIDGLEPLTQAQISAKAREFRRQARKEIYINGLSAVIRDEEGNIVYFEEGTASKERKRIKLEDGREVFEAANQKEGKGLVNIDSAVSLVAFRKTVEAEVKQNNPGKTKEQIDKLIKQKYEDFLKSKKLISVDFDAGSSHVLSHWNAQTYIALQHEIRSQILRPEVFKAAFALRKGEVLPEDSEIEIEVEELVDGVKKKIKKKIPMDVLASWRLQIDPTLTRLTDLTHNANKEERINIALLQNAVNQSFQGHWKITRELDRQFFDYSSGNQRVYYGIPNERFALKELIWNANKVAREHSRFARRAWVLIPESPVHWSSFADMAGLDISGLNGIFKRSLKYDQEFQKEATDSNVIGGWIEDVLKAYSVYVKFARGGTENNEQVTSLMMKPFNDLDSAEKINNFIRAGVDSSDEITMYQGFRPLLGRLEKLLNSIEAQDNSRASKGALWLENAEILFLEDGRVRVLYYDNDGNPKTKDIGNGLEIPNWQDIDSHELKETGAGAHSAYTFYHYFVGYANAKGVSDYEAQAWAIWVMNRGNYLSRQNGFKNFWEFFGSKAIRTYPE